MPRRRDIPHRRSPMQSPRNTPMPIRRTITFVANEPAIPPMSDFVASIILSQIMTSDDESALRAAIEQSEQENEPVPDTLSCAQARQHIHPRRWSRGYAKQDDPDACPICMEAFKYPKSVARLKCGHLFCSGCIRKWVTTYSSTCPVCRGRVGEPDAAGTSDATPPSNTGLQVEV